MADPGISRPSVSDDEDADNVLLSPVDMNKLRNRLSEKCSAVNGFLLTLKEPADKRRMIENTLQDLLAAFNTVAAAYERLNTRDQTISSVKAAVKNTIREEVMAAVSKALPSSMRPGSSYADMASRSARPDAHKVKISNGPTVVLPGTVSFVIGPRPEQAAKFSSAEVTRRAVMEAVKPKDVNMKVSKVLSVRNNSVRIIAENADLAKIRSSPALTAAGLEVKIKDKLNPRLVIRGVPTNISSEDLLNEITAMNTDAGCTNENLKVIYRYPPRENSVASSVVVETSSDVRRGLLKQGRVYLSWQSCKVEDHLRLLQCYNCQSFGHLAKNCNSSSVCGHCTGAHATASCPSSKSTPICHNCSTARLSSIDHRAFDATKCSIMKQKLIEKARNISY